jgi:hypothetical protein
MRSLLFGLLIALLGLMIGCTSEDPSEAAASGETAASTLPDTVAVAVPWARPGSEGGMSALYATIQNGTPGADTLQAVRTSVANTVEIHESYENEDGTRGMRPMGPVPVAPGAKVALEPGGIHVMLIRLTQSLQPGDSLAVDFQFAQAGTHSLTVPIRVQPPQ